MDKASYEIRIKQWIGVIQEANASRALSNTALRLQTKRRQKSKIKGH